MSDALNELSAHIAAHQGDAVLDAAIRRSEEHTSELQSPA